MLDDQSLLRRYVERRDPSAFAALVSRHIDLVYATAQRRWKPEADDVTQAVFILLAEKADTLTAHRSLAGWLHRATHLCSANARKLAARRTAHEREAAMQRSVITDDAATQEMLARLDDWIRKLPGDLREAVVLRYLEDRSIDESATLLGVSPAAVAKRASRGLERLRDRAAAHQLSGLTATSFGAIMITQSARRAPAALVHAAGTNPSAAAKLLASKTSLGMLGSTAAVAALAAAAVLTVGVITVLAAGPGNVPAAPDTKAAPVPMSAIAKAAPRPALPTPAEEAAVSGETTMLHFSTLLTQDALAAITAVSTAVPGSPVLRTGSAGDVLAALRTSADRGQLVEWDTNIVQGFTFSIGTKYGPERLEYRQFWNDVQRGPHRYIVSTTWSGQNGVVARQLAGGSIDVTMSDPALEAFIEEYSHEPNYRHTDKVPIQWAGQLTPGQALLVVNDFPPVGDDHFIAVTVTEAYRCTQPQFDYLAHVLDAKEWIEQGPAGARSLADQAIAFSKSAPTDPQLLDATAARWTRSLDNGATVQLIGSTRPVRQPFCWWDGDGHPLTSSHDYNPLITLQTPRAVAIKVDGLRDRPFQRTATQDVKVLPDDGSGVQVWVGNGPFHEQPIKLGETVKLGDGYVKLTHVFGKGPTEVATFKGDLGPEIDAYIDVITADGKRINTTRDSSVLIADDTTPRWKREDENIQVETALPTQYILRWQERQLATFEGFRRRADAGVG